MIVSFPGVRPPAAVHLAFFGGTMAAAVTQADLDRLREDLRTDIRTALSPRLGGVLRSLFLQLFHV